MVTKSSDKLLQSPDEMPAEADQVLTDSGKQFGDGFLIKKSVTLAAATTSYKLFKVTGLVAVKVIGYIKTATTSHADTMSVGTTSSAAGLIAATAATATQTANQVWVDNAPSKFETFPSGYTLIGNGEDIALASTVNIVAGVIDFYCFYKPLEAGSGVAAA
jgi:hypothetical protein